MSKKAYQTYENVGSFITTVNGRLIEMKAGEVYETSDADEQRELDAQVAMAGSGVKAASKSADKKEDK